MTEDLWWLMRAFLIVVVTALVVLAFVSAGVAVYSAWTYESPCEESMGCGYYRCLADENRAMAKSYFLDEYQACLLEQHTIVSESGDGEKLW